MSYRTNADAVRSVLMDDYGPREDGTLPDLAPFIATADALVDDVAAYADGLGVPLAAARLELIERWLAAHFYAVSDKPLASTNTQGASSTFHGVTGKYLESTLYGQTAIRLDSSGYLTGEGGSARPTAGAFWLGKRPSEQVPFWRRD